MTFEEFQHLARLSVVGALDADEAARFEAGRRWFGDGAECFLRECLELAAALALSLPPCEPDPCTKRQLMARVYAMKRRDNTPGGVHEFSKTRRYFRAF